MYLQRLIIAGETETDKQIGRNRHREERREGKTRVGKERMQSNREIKAKKTKGKIKRKRKRKRDRAHVVGKNQFT